MSFGPGMDTLNPDDYLIAIVQIPPGQTSSQLLDVSKPKTAKFLRKFCKRIVSNPSTAVSKSFQLTCEKEDKFILSVTKESPVPISFVGKGSNNQWYLRHLPTHRLTVKPYSFSSDMHSVDNITDVPNSTDRPVSSYRVTTDPSNSPQLITSSDEERDGCPVSDSAVPRKKAKL
ncbi:hypothetical protein P879_07900 [Paragonimus westermani]|uniref:Uncharacterized protein n=1 Tax=Paragonimus westermani TaxID=34504 RepID=A0A8T0DKR5_9TREM|nr:hypothetical protein P879_07900 [Paragonimus westermani]